MSRGLWPSARIFTDGLVRMRACPRAMGNARVWLRLRGGRMSCFLDSETDPLSGMLQAKDARYAAVARRASEYGKFIRNDWTPNNLTARSGPPLAPRLPRLSSSPP